MAKRRRAYLPVNRHGNAINDLIHGHGHERGETRDGINLVKGTNQSQIHQM